MVHHTQHEQAVFQLVMKHNAKELNPQFFDADEQAKFDTADMAEWRQWITNQVVKLVDPEEEKRNPASKIITAPMLILRVNRGKLPDLVTGDVKEALAKKFTKRIVAGRVATFFDPLGLFSPAQD